MLHDLFVFGLIVSWVIKAARAMISTPPTTSPGAASKPVAPPRVKRPPVKVAQPPAGYAGRSAQARNPDHFRAMESASPRLAEGAEYPAIVAERAADRADELRFAGEVQQLIASEPAERRILPTQPAPKSEAELGSELFGDLTAMASGKSTILKAVILSEILAPPHCRRNSTRQLRR